jgi:mannosyl-3-phosphoglycerate synthase
MFDLHTVKLPHLWQANDLRYLDRFVRKAAFVVCHKSEPINNLWRVLWYLPANAPIIISTNCPLNDLPVLQRELREHLPHHHLHVIHQKDPLVARYFAKQGVHNILGNDGLVVNGKGEGMYLGTMVASALGAEWVVFYDADNLAPSILMAFTMSLSRMFLPSHPEAYLHNVRINWFSKPDSHNPIVDTHKSIMGRCSRVIAPVFDLLVHDWFEGEKRHIITTNAGEQAFTLASLHKMRFSAAFTIETFLLLELMSIARENYMVRLDQYLSQSPFFHTKKDDEHIEQMIADSLSSFLPFWDTIPDTVRGAIEYIKRERGLTLTAPNIYPPLDDLDLSEFIATHHRFRVTSAVPEA